MESNNEARHDSPHFGAALQELEAIVDRLEGHPDLELEEALGLYERGAALANRCRTLLAGAELRVSQLAAESACETPGNPAD